MFRKIALLFMVLFASNACFADVLKGGTTYNYNIENDTKFKKIEKPLSALEKKFVEVDYLIYPSQLDMLNQDDIKTSKTSNPFYSPNTPDVPKSYEISFSTGHIKANREKIETLKLLVQQYPNNKDVLFAYAIQLKNENNLEKALIIVNKIIDDEPNHVLAHFLKGDILRQKNMFQDAVNEYIHTAQLNPYCADAYYNIARIFEILDVPDVALDYYKMAYKINPNDAEIRNIIMENYKDL